MSPTSTKLVHLLPTSAMGVSFIVPPPEGGPVGITMITSQDGTVTVVDPTGPTVDLSVPGSGYASLTGTGRTTNPGDLVQNGSFTVQNGWLNVATNQGCSLVNTGIQGLALSANGGTLNISAGGNSINMPSASGSTLTILSAQEIQIMTSMTGASGFIFIQAPQNGGICIQAGGTSAGASGGNVQIQAIGSVNLSYGMGYTGPQGEADCIALCNLQQSASITPGTGGVACHIYVNAANAGNPNGVISAMNAGDICFGVSISGASVSGAGIWVASSVTMPGFGTTWTKLT